MVKKKIKIAYVMTPITFGGSERVNLNFLTNVDRQKYDIHPILIIRPWENQTTFEKELIKCKFSYSKIPVAKHDGFDLWRHFRCLFKLNSIVINNSFDLMHSHGYLSDIMVLLVAKLHKIPIVSTCHGFVFNDNKLKLYFKLDLLALNLFNSVIAVSTNIKQYLVSNKINESIVDVIPNAVDIQPSNIIDKSEISLLKDKYGIIEKDLILGYVGRISSEKGIKYLLDSVSLLKNANLSVKLLIIGDGPDYDEMQKLVKENHITNEVIFLGFQENIFLWLNTMDLFVLPSLTEGTPLALLEAMSAGVPVVATRVGGVPDIIKDGINGVLVTPGSKEAIAEAIIKLSSDKALISRIVNNAKDLIDNNYSITNWIVKIQAHYESILKTR